jgi:hypothetical protein
MVYINISLRGEMFYWGACTKPVKGTVVYLCARDIDFASFYNLYLLDFLYGLGTVSTLWYFLYG